MKKITLFLFFQTITLILFSQTAPNKYWIQFTDKNNTSYSISSPEVFLSQKALDRRQKQNIPILLNDLPITPMYIDSIEKLGAKVLLKSKWFNAITIMALDSNVIDSVLLDTINKLSFVQKIDSVAYMKFKNGYKESSNKLTDFTVEAEGASYGLAYTQVAMVKGQLIHQLGYRGEGMTIAVLDNGFANVMADSTAISAFDSLRLQGRLKGSWDFIDGDSNVYHAGSHGTNVLSVMAGNLPKQFLGTAPRADYWLFRTEAPSEYRIEEDNWIAAAEFADSVGVDVINSSLGYNTFDASSMDYSLAEMDGNTARITIGADIAASKGILVVNSAGNEGGNSWGKIIAPSDGDSVFSIGAVNAAGQYASFSSKGPTADGRIKPNVVAQGAGTVLISSSGFITASNGTSFSSPLIAGMVACLWQAHPEKSNMEIIDAIQQSASQYTNPDNLLGYGIPDFYCAHFLLSDSNCSEVSLPDEKVLYKILPNPFTDDFALWVRLGNEDTLHAYLYDMMGREILYKTIATEFSINLKIHFSEAKSLSAGMYILNIVSEEQNQVFNLLKN